MKKRLWEKKQNAGLGKGAGRKTGRRLGALAAACLMAFSMVGCGSDSGDSQTNGNASASGEKGEVVQLKWIQIGDTQEDMPKVLEKVNEYTAEKIGVTIDITQISFGDYNSKLLVSTNTGEDFDLVYTCSWAHDYASNAQKGAFLALDDYLPTYGKEMYESIDKKFWEAAKINGKIYAVPNEKEIGSMPMWVFTKEYVDKYNIPFEDIHSLEDLEPYLKIIKEKEPEVVPLYLSHGFSAPTYMDLIQNPIGIEFGDDTMTVKNLFETDKMMDTLKTMRKYYEAGYINQDAATVTADKTVKRFVTKGDGQPYAEAVWSKDLGYEVVASPIMDTIITNGSARGAMTAVSRTSKHPEKAVEFLNLVNTDEYLRNLLNYGIEGEHWEKLDADPEEVKAAKDAGKQFIYDYKVKTIPEGAKRYSVPYYAQGSMFNTYVMESDPIDKWDTFRTFNEEAVEAPSFGFNFDTTPVQTEIAAFQNILNEYGGAIYTGSVDPEEYVGKLLKKMEAAGADKVVEEMQKQVDAWVAEKGK